MLGRGADPNNRPIGKLVKTLAAGVGLASETYQHQKEKKQLKQQNKSEERGTEYTQSEETTAETTQEEEVWRLDELQEELVEANATPGSSDETASPSDVSELAATFIQTHQLSPPYQRVPARLELPVIITQRRPKDRTRGFIRAYAPLLQDVGIDQRAFIDFIDTLNKAVKPSPWIQAINLASIAVQHVPAPVTIAVSIACRIATDAASAAHSRFKTNTFLDKVNEEYFRPNGLVALLVTWKPNDASIVTDFGSDKMGSNITKVSSPGSSTSSRWKRKMQPSSGATSFEFPETAPLIFPALDDELMRAEDGDDTNDNDPAKKAKKQSALKRGGAFLADYQDRRAVATWAGKNPESKVANAAPAPEFRSRYSDPNHPASSGDLLAFVTGGKVSASSLQPERGGRGGGFGRGSILDARREQMMAMRQSGRSGRRPLLVGGVVGGVKGLLQKVSELFLLLFLMFPYGIMLTILFPRISYTSWLLTDPLNTRLMRLWQWFTEN